MNETPTITIDMDRRCDKCGKKGAAQGGLCLNCVSKIIAEKTRKANAMIGEKTIQKIEDLIAEMLGDEAARLNDAYIKAEDDPLVVNITAKLQPDEGGIKIDTKLSFTVEKAKAEAMGRVHEGQKQLFE